ncbi:MAG: nitroreductase family protein [Patescibacteria group bacterium]|nr:nitroreductase family protein [Patescibacteria group bacterium]
MDFFETLLKRHSVRAYQTREVEDEKLEKIMGAGLHSASARNRQPYQVYVVKNQSLREKIVQANFKANFWMKEAPVIMVICINASKLPNQGTYEHNYLDAGIMTGNMMLTATAQGLGSCACAAFDKDEVRKIIDIPKDLKPILCLPIGYPREDKKGKFDLSKSYEKLAHFLTHYKKRKINDIFKIK